MIDGWLSCLRMWDVIDRVHGIWKPQRDNSRWTRVIRKASWGSRDGSASRVFAM